MKTPDFWTRRGPISVMLLPAALLWAAATMIRKLLAHEATVALPVICVGNLSAGGTGKTPISALLYDQLNTRGYKPAILIRGYGGSTRKPLWVDHSAHWQ